MILQPNEIIVDGFAGGGGAGYGIFKATGRHADVAINHDPKAISVYKRNSPETDVRCESIWKAEPVATCNGRPVGLAWFSPDCRHFSRAAGGKPKWKSVRSLPGVVLTWAKRVQPRFLVVENVREMLGWGPLLQDGTPCPKRIGRSFNCWVGRLRGMGYKVQWRELCAADFGAPTIRTRLVIVATLGDAIVWPQATHSRKPSMFEKPWRTAGECIDWSIPCPSIFTRKKPLAEATLRRIAEGIMRYVVNAERPYIVPVLTAAHISVMRGTSTGYGADKPLGTITAGGNHEALVAAHLAPITHRGRNRGSSLDSPLPTVTCAHRGEQALISATLIQTSYGERQGQAPRVPGLGKPLGTVVAGGQKHAVVGAYVAQHNSGVIGRSADEPLSTVTTTATQQAVIEAFLSDEDRAGAERVYAFLISYYSQGGKNQSLHTPLGAITTKDRFALVVIDGVGIPIVDIGMRMLSAGELKKATGFPDDYDLTDGGKIGKTGQVKLIGNAVCPDMAEAVVRSIFGYPSPMRLAA